jgi:hypothetical protein
LHFLLPLTRLRLKQTYRDTAGFFPKRTPGWHRYCADGGFFSL